MFLVSAPGLLSSRFNTLREILLSYMSITTCEGLKELMSVNVSNTVATKVQSA